jgi:hypothetical protein
MELADQELLHSQRSVYVQWHELTHHADGISSCKFVVLGQRSIGDAVTIFSVDLRAAEDPAATTSADDARIAFTEANVSGYLRKILPPDVSLPPSKQQSKRL